MKWNNIKITIFKEIRGVVRDKKALSQVIYMPLMIPLFILLMGFMFDMMQKTDYEVGVNYEVSTTENVIINEIGELKMVKYDSKEAMEKAYEEKEISGYIVKDEDTATYTIYADSTGNSGQMITMYLTSYLEAYNKSLATDYLNSQDIDTAKVYNIVNIKTENLGDENANSLFTILLSMSVTFIVMIIVLAAGVVATDATAGEKERGTLETILTFPIKSKELITGKYLAIAFCGMVLGFISLIITFPSIYIGKMLFTTFETLNINITIGKVLLLILLIVITALLTAGVSMALTGKSKSYKEAQSSLQFLSFLTMLPYFLEILEIDSSFFYVVPIANCGMALNDIIMNKINVSSMLVIIISTIIYTVIMIIFISKQYKSEKTLFS